MGDHEHFATLFDGGFLPQGLALHASLERQCLQGFTLYILCMDDAAFEALSDLSLDNVVLVHREDIWSEELTAATTDRTRGELCWTLTPVFVEHVLKKTEVERVTYVDADLFFFRNPRFLLTEFLESGRDAQVTLHGYGPDYDSSALHGRYCVQFLTFRNSGLDIVEDWKRKCIEWCYSRVEDDRFGDQKYLDQWEREFRGRIHVLAHAEMLQAPWNADRFAYSEAVAFHFHGLRFLGGERVQAYRGYSIPLAVRRGIYEPYLQELASSISRMRTLGIEPKPQGNRISWFEGAGVLLRKLRRACAKMVPYKYMKLPGESTL